MKEYANSFVVEEKDITEFGKSSKDKNELHINNEYAKKTYYGENVVHGMLGVIYVLKKLNIHTTNYNIKFLSPLYREHQYTYDICGRGKKQYIRIRENNSIMTEIVINTEKENKSFDDCLEDCEIEIKEVACMETPYDIVDDFIQNDYIIQGDYCIEYSDKHDLQEINFKLCSYIVGMIIPGKRSLFIKASNNISNKKVNTDILKYRIYKIEYNDILGILEIKVKVLCNREVIAINNLQAYVRKNFKPTEDMPKYEVNEKIGKNERILIVGGTKGIGLELAKKYVVQGAKVIITFYHDYENASIIKEIFHDEHDKVEIIRCNVLDLEECINLSNYIKNKYKSLDSIFLSAAPSPKNIELYIKNLSLFQKYINQSLEMFSYPFFSSLELLKPKGNMIIFSSIAVLEKERFSKMIEYICAKNMIENIVENIALKENARGINFYIIRPTKMLTEMNNTPVGRVGAIPPRKIANEIYNSIRDNKDLKTNLIYLNIEKEE